MAFNPSFTLNDKRLLLSLHKGGLDEAKKHVPSKLTKAVMTEDDIKILNSGCHYKNRKMIDDYKTSFSNTKHVYEVGLLLDMKKAFDSGSNTWKSITSETNIDKVDSAIQSEISNKNILNDIKNDVVAYLKTYMTKLVGSDNANNIKYESLDLKFYTPEQALALIENKDFTLQTARKYKNGTTQEYAFALYRFAYTIGLKN